MTDLPVPPGSGDMSHSAALFCAVPDGGDGGGGGTQPQHVTAAFVWQGGRRGRELASVLRMHAHSSGFSK
jgi:hypothetical protein